PDSTLFPYTTLFRSRQKPERLADLFIQINNDLAYAQTYYPKSNVIRYLNALTITAYHKIYGQRKSKKGMAGFWKYEIPMLMYHRSEEHTSELQSREN